MAELLKTQQTLAMAETMAMALAEVGRFDEAVKWQQDTIAAACGPTAATWRASSR